MELLYCDMCGKEIYRYKSTIKKHNFCSKSCLAKFSNKKTNPLKYNELKDFSNISKTFKRLNKIINKKRMTPEIKEKIRLSQLDKGNNSSYRKYYGRHEHRAVAEELLGRPLIKGEVVHHIDGNKRNNSKENLMIFSSQSEHAKYHAKLRKEMIHRDL